MALTIETAEQIAREYYKATPHEPFLEAHSKLVYECAMQLCREEDRTLIGIAAWLHDIGYSRAGKDDLYKHAHYSINILEETGIELDDILRDSILNHGREPKTAEGKVIQVADKASFFDTCKLKHYYLDHIEELRGNANRSVREIMEDTASVFAPEIIEVYRKGYKLIPLARMSEFSVKVVAENIDYLKERL